MKTRLQLTSACALLTLAIPAGAATISKSATTPATTPASGASRVESVTITLPAGLLTNPKLFVRVVGISN